MPMTDDEIAKLKTDHETATKAKDDEIAKLKADLEKHTKKPDPPDDPGLAAKARAEAEEKEKKAKHEKSLESALSFNLSGKDFVKANQSLLPKTVEGIFTAADKEKYDSAIEKANAIKVEIVNEYFSIQANYDLLTQTQKTELEEFRKLTKNGKQDRVENIYSMIFEPTLETARKIEKAKQLNNGNKNQTDTEKALAERLMKMSKKHYLGEKYES